MLTKRSFLIAAALLSCWTASSFADYASVRGLKMYYEIHGSTDSVPLVLLHGGGSTIESNYGRLLPLLAAKRRVIAIEEQAHGRTSDRKAPVRFESSADDVAALLEQLRVPQADVMGFSNGASVGLQVAIRHPALVRRLIFASSITKRSGTAPGFWSFIEKATFDQMPETLKAAFLKVTPDPKKLRLMHDKDLERMRHFQDVSDRDVAAVQAPVLVLQGDRDVPTLEHGLELARLFPHARLLIVPGGHGDYLGEVEARVPNPSAIAGTAAWIDAFLSAANPLQ